MQTLQIIRNNRGITLIEMLITMAVSSVLVIATAITVTSVTQWGKSSGNSSTAYDMMISMGRSFQSQTAWSRTVSDPLNTTMTCLVNHTDCSGQGGAFRVNDDNGNLVYDTSAVGGGGKLSGFGNGGLCTSFDATTESPNCPYRYEVSWAPQCPTTGTCINPPIRVTAKFVSSASKSSSEVSMNSSNYSISYDMGSFNPVAPVLTPSLLYTNMNESVSADVLSILGSGASSKVIKLSVPAHGTVSQGSGGLVTYTPSANYHGLDTFNATIQAPNGSHVTATVYAKVMTKFTWTGAASDPKWTTPRNWCGLVVNNACSNVSDLPGNGNKAIFDTSCTRNCAASINASVSLGGIEISKGFKATITQEAGSSINLNSSGYYQADGAFKGSDANIFISGSDFQVTGDTASFISTSGNLESQGSFQVATNSKFSNSNGQVTISYFSAWPPPPHVVNLGGHELQDFYLKANTTIDLSNTTTVVRGKLTLGNNNWSTLNNGVINAYADIDVFGPWGGYGNAQIAMRGNQNGQTIAGYDAGGFGSITNFLVDTGSNAVMFKGHTVFAAEWLTNGYYKILSGKVSFDPASTVEIAGLGNMTINTGANNVTNYANFTITAKSGGMLDFGSTETKVDGLLTLASPGNSGGCLAQLLNGGIKAYGDIQLGTVGSECAGWGSTLITAAGNSNGQTITSVLGASIANLAIDSGSNEVTLSGNLTMTSSLNWSGADLPGSFLIKSGKFKTANNDLVFTGWLQPIKVVPGNIVYDSVTFNGVGGANVDLSGGTMKVKKLNAANADYKAVPTVDNGIIAVSGDVNISNSGIPGTAVVQIVGGSGGQTITTHASTDQWTTTALSNLEIKTSDSVKIVGNLSISGAWGTGSFKNTSNTVLDMSDPSSKLSFTGSTPILITPGTTAYQKVDFTMGGDNGNASLGGNTMVVSGLLNLNNSCYHRCGEVDGGTISARGDVVINGPQYDWTPFVAIGDVNLRFEGSGTQKLKQTYAQTTGSVVVNTSGSLTLDSDVTFSGSSSAKLQSGVINLAGHKLSVPGSLDLSGNTLTKSAGVLIVNGTVAGTGNLYAGTVNP